VRASLGRHREAAGRRRGSAPPGADVSPDCSTMPREVYAQCPSPYRDRALPLIPEGLELATRRRASSLLVQSYSIGCRSGHAAPGILRSSNFITSCPRGSDSWLFEGQSLVCARPTPTPVVFPGHSTAIGFERRTPAAASPLAMGCPFAIRRFQRRSGNRTSCPFRTSSTSTRSRSKKARRSMPVSTPKRRHRTDEPLRVFQRDPAPPLALDNQLGAIRSLTFRRRSPARYYIGVSSAPTATTIRRNCQRRPPRPQRGFIP